MEYKNKSSVHWRTYLVNGVNSDNYEVSNKTSDFIVDNLIRYYKGGLELGEEGYKELERNWETIKSNSKYSRYDLYRAERYMKKERRRLESLVWKEPKYHINCEEKPRFFSRLKLRLGLG